MKKTSYFLALLFTGGLIFTTTLSGVSSKDKNDGAPSKQQTSATKPATESGWLNQKNFPWIQQNPCPFYVVVKPGC